MIYLSLCFYSVFTMKNHGGVYHSLKITHIPENCISVIRHIKPRLSNRCKINSVDFVIFVHSAGQTSLLIMPGFEMIESSEILKMIEEGKEEISLSSNLYITRQDLLKALLEHQGLPCENENETQKIQTSIDKKVEPRRPSNAFLLYRSAYQIKTKKLFPEFSNRDISKYLGAMWKIADANTRNEYIQKAKERRERHKILFPNYQYKKSKSKKKEKSKAETAHKDKEELGRELLFTFNNLECDKAAEVKNNNLIKLNKTEKENILHETPSSFYSNEIPPTSILADFYGLIPDYTSSNLAENNWGNEIFWPNI
ncbi:hypothetical protein BDB01DRAFT_837010 [Pilobolus umbonatus]|nr:hypothetical protein BDB01DRAFT_837010 [Pilobolus umbonatus]